MAPRYVGSEFKALCPLNRAQLSKGLRYAHSPTQGRPQWLAQKRVGCQALAVTPQLLLSTCSVPDTALRIASQTVDRTGESAHWS